MKKCYSIDDFPRVIGAVDGTHVEMLCANIAEGEHIHEQERYYSLNFLVVARVEMEIYNIVARLPGTTHDSRTFSKGWPSRDLGNGRVSFQIS